MTIETLEKRIAGKEKAIATLEKKIQRIEAAKATNWEKNPYYYDEQDLKWAKEELASEMNVLVKYREQLKQEQEKVASRNVEALVTFLETWKEDCISYFLEEHQKYLEARKEYYAAGKQFCERFNSRRALGLTTDEINKLEADYKKLRETFKQRWRHVIQFDQGSLSWEETMRKHLEIEKNRKYDDIIKRTNKVVGKIADASGLHVGAKGDLNGIIIGTEGKAKVETIGAGGYNEDVILESGRHGQCYHFRTLIHEIN